MIIIDRNVCNSGKSCGPSRTNMAPARRQKDHYKPLHNKLPPGPYWVIGISCGQSRANMTLLRRQIAHTSIPTVISNRKAVQVTQVDDPKPK